MTQIEAYPNSLGDSQSNLMNDFATMANNLLDENMSAVTKMKDNIGLIDDRMATTITKWTEHWDEWGNQTKEKIEEVLNSWINFNQKVGDLADDSGVKIGNNLNVQIDGLSETTNELKNNWTQVNQEITKALSNLEPFINQLKELVTQLEKIGEQIEKSSSYKEANKITTSNIKEQYQEQLKDIEENGLNSDRLKNLTNLASSLGKKNTTILKDIKNKTDESWEDIFTIASKNGFTEKQMKSIADDDSTAQQAYASIRFANSLASAKKDKSLSQKEFKKLQDLYKDAGYGKKTFIKKLKNAGFSWKDILTNIKEAGSGFSYARLAKTFSTSKAFKKAYISVFGKNKWNKAIKDKTIQSYDTGGYTGEWSDGPRDGRLAMLHQKELVLNANDTQHILDAVDIVRDIVETLKGSSLASSLGTLSSGRYLNNSNNPIEQRVSIEATFPNATNADEIERALLSLSDSAFQYAYKTRD